MSTIVKIHNAVNEQTWREVLRWEYLYHGFGVFYSLLTEFPISPFPIGLPFSLNSDCVSPRLIRFQGDASKFTPKARVKSFLG